MAKRLLKLIFSGLMAYGLGVLARQLFLGYGDESSDDFELVTIMQGKQFRSRAHRLWSGRTSTVMGGLELDLCDATLGAEGADLTVATVMGGTALRVPDTWLVEIDGTPVIGGHTNRTTPSVTLPPDAPRLRVHAHTYLGGLDVVARPLLH